MRRLRTFPFIPHAIPKAPVTPGWGFTYVVKFSVDLIKVGHTTNPYKRVLDHHGQALAFGTKVTHFWVSPEHQEYRASEAHLIGVARSRATEIRRDEYFVGVKPELLINQFIDPSPDAIRTRERFIALGWDGDEIKAWEASHRSRLRRRAA